jgi:hypothetical protein
LTFSKGGGRTVLVDFSESSSPGLKPASTRLTSVITADQRRASALQRCLFSARTTLPQGASSRLRMARQRASSSSVRAPPHISGSRSARARQ